MSSARILPVLWTLLIASAALHVPVSAEAPKVPQAVGRAMQDRDYEAALKAIDAADKEKQADQDYLAYLKGRALHLANKHDEAVAAFDAASEKFPKSPWARRARFAKGVSLARKGDFQKAEQVYRAEAEYLLSAGRKQELADIYLEFADAYFKPAKEDAKPDYAKAREFYEKALEVGPLPEKQIEIELAIARCFQKLDKHQEAIDRYQAFIAKHPGHASQVEARFRLGESQFAGTDAEEARRTWQDLLALHKDAKSERLPEAAFNIALTYGVPEPGEKEDLDLGVAALKAFAQEYPDHKQAAEALLDVALSYFNFGRHEEAVASAKKFLADARYAQSDKVPAARKLLGDALKEQGKFDEALAAWGEFLARHPTDPAWSEVQRQLVDAEFDKAHARFAAKDHAAARELWTAFLARYPLDDRGPGILYRFGQMSYLGGKWDAAVSDWRRLVAKHPDTNEASQAQFMIGLVQEEKLDKLDEALKEYKKTTWGNFAKRAQLRIARLTAKDLQVATERVFRSGETPQVKITTRNIDAVTVQVYAIDMETYFRKMHLGAGIDKLDIALIDPDQTFEYQIPKYEEYRKFEREVEVPLPKMEGKAADAGALAVTVSSKTLEATTLVLQSDLDIIVKSSRDELFVFAENMKTGKPWPKARVLVSDGIKVIAEGITGEDGVLQRSFPELNSAESARIFAAAGRHAAANVVALDGASGAKRAGVGATGPARQGAFGRGADPKVLAALNEPTTLKFIETPLKDVLGYLKGVHRIEIQVDEKSLDGVGVSVDTPVTRNLKGISLRSALRLMLKELELSFLVRNDTLVITTPEVVDDAGQTGDSVSTLVGAETKIVAALDDPTTLEFVKTPLRDVIAYLKELHGIEIQLDIRSMNGIGISEDTPITRHLKGVSLRTALRLMLKELELTSTISDEVLLITTPEVAENVLPAAGPQGLAAKGYIYTDRPAYRAGQMVHVRGIIRQVSADAYVVQKGAKHQVVVHDNRDRLLFEAEVALNDYGAFHLNFQLPADASPGDYRILVRDADDKESYQGTFAVREYQLEPVRIEVETPRNIYYRGEEIEGKIKVSYYYGAPLAGRELRYSLAGGHIATAKTDAKGEAAFKLPTREFRESQALEFSVELPERSLAMARNFFLVTQGFGLKLETVRPVYLAGETFEVKLKAFDAEAKPLAQALTLSVYKQTIADDKVGEVLSSKHELKTDAKDGLARQTLRLEKGGQYVLRAEGTDRFSNPVSAETKVTISDDRDATRLRILADRHTFKAGETARVQLHWREGPALALVTYQGAKILKYQLVNLKPGANALDVPMTARLAPNFELAVTVMTDARTAKPKPGEEPSPVVRFHEASSPFEVEQDLAVKVAVQKKGDAKTPPQPGDEVEVTITATDPQGKPVQAELSLAMVEKSLLARFSPREELIGRFFRAAQREPAVRTASSVTFAYRPQTHPINAQLLAEKDRLELLEEEASRLAEIRVKGAVGGIDLALDAGGKLDADRPSQLPFVTSIIPVLDGGKMRSEDDPFAGLDKRRKKLQGMGMGGMGGIGGMPAGAQGTATGRIFPVGDQVVGLGGRGAASDFDHLIDLITRVSAPNTWEEAGGAGSIEGFPSHLSLVVSQTQDVPHHPNFTGTRDYGTSRLLGPITLGAGKFDYAGFAAVNGNEVQLLLANGVWTNTNFGVREGQVPDAKQIERFVAELTKQGAVLLPHLAPHETAYWNPVITTDAKGEAKITITLPERSTAWMLHAKGITAETLAGSATAELTVKKDLFGELKLPAAFTDGDSAQIIASVHNDVLDKGPVKVVLKTTLGGKSASETKTIDVKAKGIEELVFAQKIELPADATSPGAPGGLAEFELTITAGERRDVLRRSVPVNPFGTSVFAVAGGTAAGDTLAVIEQPAGMKLQSPRLQIVLGPTVEQSLLDVVLAPATWCQLESSRVAAGAETAAGDLMASLALQRLLAASRDAGAPPAQALDARVRSSISILTSRQNEDGGWRWAGGKGESDRYTSARVVWALALAKGAGYRVGDEAYNKALTYLHAQLGRSGVADYETKAVLLQALASAGAADFPLANQLYRNRAALSPAGLAHLALAFAEMDRKQTAGELLDLVAKQNLDAAPKRTAGSLAWTHAAAELRAIYALALDKSLPADARLKEQVDWLMAHRTGNRWTPEKATGPATLALCQWFARTRFKGEHYKLSVFVNDLLARELDVTDETTTQTIDVPAKLLSPKLAEGEKQRVRFVLTGRGRFTYQCVLGGFVAADKLKSTTPDWSVSREYSPAALEFDGRLVPRGFDILVGDQTGFRNDLTQLPVGQRGRVTLEIKRHNVAADAPAEQLEYLIVSEPLPAGASVVESSIAGDFERFELAPGAITFYIGNRPAGASLSYEMHGYLPGAYRAAPAIVRNAYRPDQFAATEPRQLAVLPLGAKSGDKYRLSPRELFELGKLHFDKGQFESAAPLLSEAFTDWNLAPGHYKEAVRMLLETRLQVGPPAEVVKFFEIILEKYPDLVISFDNYLKIGEAYRKIGEYERGYLVYRATVEASFLRESLVAGSLQAQGHFLRSVELTERLLREYPSEGYVAAATYALAQRVHAAAPRAAADPRLREAKVNRVDLVRRGLAMFDHFLTGFPDDPAADQASFSLANALLDLEAYQEAIEACERFAARYPASDFLDSYWFISGYCRYARGDHERALEMCRKVAAAKRVEKATGKRVESPNKWQAIYILGQIHDSLGEAAAAIAEYERVKDRFEDARAAIAYFARRELSLPEVTTHKPGEAASVELKSRNLAACDATVYRIDLLKFSLLRRSLADIANINLSGIRPYHEARVKLGEGEDYRDRTAKLELPLADEGAYLVVCRGDDLYASGLVLVTPLVVEAQEDPVSGRVRATVRDRVKNESASDVHVKVIGSRNADFTSGKTDLRGVFVADAIQGKSMVIAQAKGGRYAFFRGASDLGPPPDPADLVKSQERLSGKPQKGAGGKDALLDALKGSNSLLQQEQEKQLLDLQNGRGMGGGMGGMGGFGVGGFF